MTPRIKKLVLAALIFLAAFVVRYYNWQLEGINPDEPAWQTRIENFTSAISRGEWQYTQQSLHPGVTLNWIASFGRALSGYNSPGRLVYPFVDPLIFWSVHFSELFMIILVVASGCGLIFWLLTRLLDTPTAFGPCFYPLTLFISLVLGYCKWTPSWRRLWWLVFWRLWFTLKRQKDAI